ncbi:synaptosomal-associated protein 29 [Ischnura elegans]|uniref:synaptosomal-associated protein 29 n=1 Tax=Ischnura elegans TaxID=197161 RepID=UPI001ED87631|nr:synaptosomal-associated protein 29 [Ischnura elegans]
MAGYNYNSAPKNPFYPEEDDDVDDETFLRGAKKGNSSYMLSPEYDQERELEEKRLQLLERKKMIEERTIQSSQRSIGILRESEQIGVATAEELVKQREQLERTERRLDDINSTLRTSQKHIQSIKSVFGSLKNYLSGRPNEVPRSQDMPRESSRPSPLTQRLDELAISERNEYVSDHPGLRVRGLGGEVERPSGHVGEILNKNLDEISGSISRLKGLARGLGEEIDVQNDLIENISTKADRADLSITRQNRDMKQILKK